jgi:hypothetical protein
VNYIPLLGLSAASLAGRGVGTMCQLLRLAGWSGLEIIMFPGQQKTLEKVREIAPDMRVSLHQPWSYAESGGLLVNRILDYIGYLAPPTYTLDSCVERGSGELFVAYADRVEEVVRLRSASRQEVVWALQTATTWIGVGEARRNRMAYDDFIRVVHLHKLPVVFDTFHVLEWKLQMVGKRLCDLEESRLATVLLDAWNEIGPERISEIHWNDFVSKDNLSDGRACLPGEGRLKQGLTILAGDIRRRGWRGYIIPEVSPLLLFPFSHSNLVRLRERMQSFFV